MALGISLTRSLAACNWQKGERFTFCAKRKAQVEMTVHVIKPGTVAATLHLRRFRGFEPRNNREPALQASIISLGFRNIDKMRKKLAALRLRRLRPLTQ